MNSTVLVFGASGALGTAICARIRSGGGEVVPASRHDSRPGRVCTEDPLWAQGLPVLAGVVWAGGANSADTVADGLQPFQRMFEANVGYIVETLAALLAADALTPAASLVVLSSVWQRIARQDKSAYTVSKAAVGGLVRSAAADLGPRGIRINAVLPGVVQTPMTATYLSTEQIESVAAATPLGRLVTADEIAETAEWLLSSRSSGITGASIVVDGGWSSTRVL